MHVFVVGASGVLGRAAIPRLLAAGHQVTALARSPEKLLAVEKMGSRSLRGDILDGNGLARALSDQRPDVVVNLATAIPLRLKIDPRDWELNDRIRATGTANLVRACEAAGVSLLVQESVGYVCEPRGADWIDEDSPLSAHPFLRATVEMERIVRGSAAPGVLVRLGALMSADSWHTQQSIEALRRGTLPIIGDGSAYLSMVHAQDAAQAICRIVDSPGISAGKTYNVCDDAPAPMAEVIAFAARLVGGPRPKSVPAFLAKMAAGAVTVDVLAASYRMSDARIRADLDFAPAYPTYRETWTQVAAALANHVHAAARDLG